MATTDFHVASLLGRMVTDAENVGVGHVHDVRLRRDGPIIPGFGPALRVDELLVRPASFAARLGITRSNIAGPWPLDVIGKRARRRVRAVPWNTITDSGDVLRTSCRIDELRGVEE